MANRVWTITHDISGIRITDNAGTTQTWTNQTWLAESYANLLSETEQLRTQIAKVRSIVDRKPNIDLGDCQSMEKQLVDIDEVVNS